MKILTAWASYLYAFAYATLSNNKQKDAKPSKTTGDPVRQAKSIESAASQSMLTIKCILGFVFRIRKAFHPILDDPDNPWERILVIDNGLRPSDPAYEGVVLRIGMTFDGHLLFDTLECTDGLTFDIPAEHQKPNPVIRGQMVHDSGLVWAELNNHAVSPYFSPFMQPTVAQTITDTVQFLKGTVAWEDDVYDDSDDFA
jgi:hypothetical protein